MATYTLDWSETDLGGTAVTSYGSGAILDFTDKPAGATSALSITSNQSDGVDNILAEFSIVTTGSSVMTFDYKVSTESGWDKFHIDVDGVSQANYSGIVAWTSHTGINIPGAGTHTIRFRYTKDGGGAVNADRVWVALLNITNTTTVNDAAGTVDTYDMEDGAIPSAVTTSTWTNSTSEPIAGTRSLRSPASPANSGTYDLEITKPATSDWAAVGFDLKTSTESGWDKLFLFPDATASNVPATGSPSVSGESGWLDWSGSTTGRLAVILPTTESTLLLRYTKDGGGAGGSDAVWIDNLDMPATGGGPAVLVVDDARSSTRATSPTLTQSSTILVDSSRAATRATSPTLTQTSALDITDARANTRTTSPTLAQSSDLTVADARAAARTSSPTLTQTTTLIVDAARSATRASSPTLTVNDPGALSIHAARSATRATSPTLTQNSALSVLSARALARTSTPTLTTTTELVIAGARSSTRATSPTLTQSTALLVLNARSAARTTRVVMPGAILPTAPPERTLTVPAETRVLVVAAENRTLAVPAESRTITA